MSAQIIDGKILAKTKQNRIKQIIAEKGIFPHLAIILANDKDASAIYVKHKMAACAEVGISCNLYKLPSDTQAEDLVAMIESLNKNVSIHGIFLQLPVGDHLDSQRIIQSIDPRKDVDGLTFENMGKLMAAQPYLIPCTPKGVLELLQNRNVQLAGKHAVIVGRSLLFGKPMGQLLIQQNCTVTHCHSKTDDLPSFTRQADILISAIGQSGFIQGNWIKPGAIVIDVGITRTEIQGLKGDVDFATAVDVASAITPVPGGVGPMTVACLLENIVIATLAQHHAD